MTIIRVRGVTSRSNSRTVSLLLHLADADIGDADARAVAPLGEEGRHQAAGVLDVGGDDLVAALPGVAGDGDVHAVRRAPRDGDIIRRAAEDVRDGILRRRPRRHQAGVVVRRDPPLLQLLHHRFLHRRHRPARQRAAGARVQIDRVQGRRHLLPDLVNLCIHRDSHWRTSLPGTMRQPVVGGFPRRLRISPRRSRPTFAACSIPAPNATTSPCVRRRAIILAASADRSCLRGKGRAAREA